MRVQASPAALDGASRRTRALVTPIGGRAGCASRGRVAVACADAGLLADVQLVERASSLPTRRRGALVPRRPPRPRRTALRDPARVAARHRALARPTGEARSACSRACATCCPGRYAFGLTGRGPDGKKLAAGPLRAPPARLPDRRRRAPTRVRFPSTIHAVRRIRPRRTIDPMPAKERSRRDHRRAPVKPPSREPVRDRAAAAAQRSPTPSGSTTNLVNVLQECKKAVVVSVPVSMDDGTIRRLRGLPRHAQHRARPVEGRHPLPPRRHARRGQGARDVDDVEVRADGHPVRRREGRRRLRPEEAVAGELQRMTRRYTTRDHQRDRPGEGHPGPRRRAPTRASWPGSSTPTR